MGNTSSTELQAIREELGIVKKLFCNFALKFRFDILSDSRSINDLLAWRKTSEQMIVIPADMTLDAATKILTEKKISGAPVQDTKTKKFVGYLDNFDVLRFVMQLYYGTTESITVENWDPNHFGAWLTTTFPARSTYLLRT